MAVMGPGGSVAASKTAGGMTGRTTDKDRNGKGGAGTAALTGEQNTRQAAGLLGPGASIAASKTPGGMTGGNYSTKSTGAGNNTAPDGGPLLNTPNATDTTDLTGRPKYQGTSPYVADPSLGQFAGAILGLAPGVGTLNRLAGVGMSLADGDSPVAGDDGGAVGRLLDGARGVKPGGTTGYVGNRVASSSNSRSGERAVDDTRLADRASAAGTAALTGDGPDSGGAGTGALFSDVALADRRKPRSDLAGTNMLLRAALAT